MFRDVEFIKPLYNALVIAPAKWMTDYRDHSGLPLQSWDLWEERRGIHTFTVAATVAALRAAASFATDFGDTGRARWFSQGAESVLAALRKHLHHPTENRFARMAVPVSKSGAGSGGAGSGGLGGSAPGRPTSTGYELDMTPDSAGFALWWLGVLDVNDPLVVADMAALEAATRVRTSVGGYARYVNDRYHAVTGPDDKGVPGNPWIICTLWQAQWRIASATTLAELSGAMEILAWVARHTGASGVLPEQVHPHTGAPMSVSPLTWSHATFVMTTLEYLHKRRELVDPSSDLGRVGGAG
jgi:GH15 family glucan-1,4-alpha-glucosidase